MAKGFSNFLQNIPKEFQNKLRKKFMNKLSDALRRYCQRNLLRKRNKISEVVVGRIFEGKSEGLTKQISKIILKNPN